MKPRQVLIIALVGVLVGALLLVLGSGREADFAGLTISLVGICFVVELATPHRLAIHATTWVASAALMLFAGTTAAT